MTNSELKAQIDSQITNETTDYAITPTDVGTNMKAVVDYADQQDALKVDKVSGQRLLSALEITKLASQSGVNTGDQDLSVYYTKTQVDGKVTSVYRFRGNVANYAALPSTMLVIGDVFNLTDTGANWAWTGTVWDNLGTTIDVSGKEDVSNKSTDGALTSNSDTKYPSEKAVKTYVDANAGGTTKISQQVTAHNSILPDIKDLTYVRIISSGVDKVVGITGTPAIGKEWYIKNTSAYDVTLISTSDNINGDSQINLPPNSYWHLIKEDNGTNNITAFSLSLNPNENVSNKSTNVTTDGSSDVKYPSVKAVKTYVDANAGGSSSLTNATIEGGPQNAPVAITVNVLTSSNTSHLYYSVPNFTNDQSKIGTRIYVRNPTVWVAYIMAEVGVSATFYTHTNALPNGYENFQSPLAVESMRSTELIYLGNINGYERWASHLVYTPRELTAGTYTAKSFALINQSYVNNDFNTVAPVDATDNYIKLNPVYIGVGESMVVSNSSLTIDLRLLGTPLYHHLVLGLDSNTVPYIIPAGKSVRFTKGYSDFYWLAEIMHYE